MDRLVLSFCIVAVALGLFLAGCGDVPSDRLYALWLDHRPETADWERALPRLVRVKGGKPHRMRSFADIDEDTVHTTTASCHHGARLPDPIDIDVRAFYTDTDLYLRFRWVDATADQAMKEWVFDGEQWQNSGAFEDGLGVMWDTEGRFPRFSCSYACHIRDFGVSGASFHASNTMRLAQQGPLLDLWNWKAGRTGRLGFADDRYLDGKGMHGDVPGELFKPNSRTHVNADAQREPFVEGDQPIYDAERLPADEGYRPPGTRAPGYLVERPVGSRSDVSALSEHADGGWTVILRRRLNTGDARDAVFVPGDEVGVAFGVALMDNTPFEHYASTTEERLVLMKKELAAPRREAALGLNLIKEFYRD